MTSPASDCGASARGANGGRGFSGGRGVQIVDHHGGAAGSQFLGDGAADTAPGAGHQRDFGSQINMHGYGCL